MAGREHSMSRHAVRRDVVHKENVVGARALRAVRRLGDQCCGALAGIADRHRGGAAAIQTDGADTAELLQLLTEFCRRQTDAVRGLVAIDFIQNNRAVRLHTDCAACSAGRACVNAVGRDRTVVHQQLAADCILHVAPAAVIRCDGQRDFLANLEIHPRGHICAVRLGEHHLVFCDRNGTAARALVHNLELDRAVDLDRCIIHALEDNARALGCKVRRVIVVVIEQVRASRRARLVEVGYVDRAALAAHADAHSRAAEDSCAVLFEADRVLPGIGRNELAAVDDQTDRDAGGHNEKVCIRAAEHGFALILQIFHRVCDSGLAAVQLLIGVDNDGCYTGVRRVCQHVRALQTSAVFALGAAVLQAAAERVGVAEAVIENGSGSTCA